MPLATLFCRSTSTSPTPSKPLSPFLMTHANFSTLNSPSASRVEALEPFVKRVRGARTSKPVRYFWAKPSLRKNR
jgi:hypothetical protein